MSEPNDFDALTIADLLAAGIERHSAGQFDAAEGYYRAILARQPDDPDAWHLLGVIAGQRGDKAAAAGLIERAVRAKPDCIPFLCNLGTMYQESGRLDDAEKCYRRVMQLQPGLPIVHNNQGNVHRARKRLDLAVACYEHALRLDPELFEALNNLGDAYRQLGRFDEAASLLQRAFARCPSAPGLHDSLAYIAARQGRLDEATVEYGKAVALDPQSSISHMNLACVLHDQGLLEEALEGYARAVEFDPHNANAHFNRALIWLLSGRWQLGWDEYEWRWRRPDGPPVRNFTQPAWDGSSLAGRTLLVHAEQGLGDTLQFIRYCPLLRAGGARVVLETPPELMRLLDQWPGADCLVEEGGQLPDFDVHVPLLSLPRLFATRVDSIPAEVPYLPNDRTLAAAWRAKLGTDRAFRVGIVWQGNPLHDRDRFRSIPLDCFRPLSSIPGIRLYSLQKGDVRRQLAEWPEEAIVDLGGELTDFAVTAAVVAGLDLVVTCDTAIAHLAGALDAPIWLLLSKSPDWRWLLERRDSPWYPSMRLFRQPRLGDWPAVLEDVARELETMATSGGATAVRRASWPG